jgi:aspartyl/asparaginyl-tRNA synthetase
MLSDAIKNFISEKDSRYSLEGIDNYVLPDFNPQTHYIELTRSGYFGALTTLRHCIRVVSDYYFGVVVKATNVDLFMLTSSISSPMGPGSDSEAIQIKFGNKDVFLTDSAQFGFEPFLMNGFDSVYCYLPSMRGESPNKRHLNQFFHCEAEIKGGINKLFPIVENYIQALCEAVILMPNIINLISLDPKATRAACVRIVSQGEFKTIIFDEAADLLSNNSKDNLINTVQNGRDITQLGEIEIFQILNIDTPLWLTNFDRDRVAFYQKPDPQNKNKVINADLLLPQLATGSFGGEVAGSGQRQDSPEEICETLKRQGISAEPYEWYINLRRLPKYNITSGFGFGIERFLAWVLCMDDIKNVIPYPRLKGITSYP